MTDLLGVMEAWGETSTRVRGEDGTTTEIALADIVSGKPVPPRPSARMRVTAEQACLMSNASWPAVHTRSVGDWLLRASGGFSARANSVMAIGDPGRPFADAVQEALAFYAEHGLPPWAQVVVGSDTGGRFEEAGWQVARPGEADSEFQLAPVAQSARAVRRLLPDAAPEVRLDAHVSEAWLANDARATAHHDAAVAVLDGPATGRRSSRSATRWSRRAGSPWTATGPASPTSGSPPATGARGSAVVVVDAMLDWAAERGATTAYLQVRGDNPPALALYATLGFRTHHTYRYLAAPD